MNAITDIKISEELDASGMNCPLPILKTRQKIKAMQQGGVLKVISTDVGSLKDMEAFCRQTGHELLSSQDTSSTYIFHIRKC